LDAAEEAWAGRRAVWSSRRAAASARRVRGRWASARTVARAGQFGVGEDAVGVVGDGGADFSGEGVGDLQGGLAVGEGGEVVGGCVVVGGLQVGGGGAGGFG
jgi:hypothetical protein